MLKTALVLDDLEIRHQTFKEKFGSEYQSYHVYNFTEFFDFITKFPGTIDYVSLDHDLGDHTIYSNPVGKILYGTGMLAVQFLAICPEYLRPVKVNVHSHNYVRGEVMLERLINAGYTDATFEQFTED